MSKLPWGKESRHSRCGRPTVIPALATLVLIVGMGSGAGVALARSGASTPAAAPLPLPVTSSPAGSSTTDGPDDAPLDGPAEADGDAAGGVVDAAAYRDADAINDIPLPTLVAYQRAESVMVTAAPDCGLEWTVLAAIGRVLTDHGTLDGEHEVDDEGRTTPALVGQPLRDPEGGRLADTDAGELDGDKRYDRAVGPMLLAPATWQVVGLDGDADGERDPQDLDDAALATAVLLCSEGDDLGKETGLRAALRRLQADPAFVSSVLRVAADYQDDVEQGGVPAGDPPVIQAGAPASQWPGSSPRVTGDGPATRLPGERPGPGGIGEPELAARGETGPAPKTPAKDSTKPGGGKNGKDDKDEQDEKDQGGKDGEDNTGGQDGKDDPDGTDDPDETEGTDPPSDDPTEGDQGEPAECEADDEADAEADQPAEGATEEADVPEDEQDPCSEDEQDPESPSTTGEAATDESTRSAAP